MKQINIVNAYMTTTELARSKNLTISGKWALYSVRKNLLSQYEFYVEESKNLYSQYKIERNENTLLFESPKLAAEYQTKQQEIDNFEVDTNVDKITCKLSDIPDITVEQIERLENFIEFMPE